MINTTNKKDNLEIILSTMNRTSLSFLKQIFGDNDFLDFNVLIINQTSKDNLLNSPHKNIRVINSFETGLSQSRNLAVQNAIGELCLIADDDIIYRKDFKNIVVNAFDLHNSADIITFQMTDLSGDLYRSYSSDSSHNRKSVATANSVVIAFKREQILRANLNFDTNFGLGNRFATAEEYIFLRDALKSKLQVVFVPSVILSHPDKSSGTAGGNNSIIYARAALFYKYSGTLAYVRLSKYLWGLYRLKYIDLGDIIPKFRVGLKGIKDYKRISNQDL